ncbi:MAG: hypothetical protein AB7E32_13695 [Desulfovibrio sp.]
MRRTLFPLLLLVLPLFWGCGPSASMQALRPALVPLPGVHTLAVGEFSGPYGSRARDCFLERFRSSDRFQLALGEQAHAVVRAEVSSELRDERGEERKTVTENVTRVITERDAQDRVVRSYTEETPQRRIRREPYVLRSARVEARMRVEFGGRVLAEESGFDSLDRRYGGLDCPDADADCDESDGPLDRMPSGHAALAEMACAVGADLAARLLPEAYTVYVSLDEDGGEQVRRGAELADGDAWAAAVSLWQQALAENPANAPALYNLGVEQERRGVMENLQQAQALYGRAFGLDPKERYAEALERIAGRIRDAQELERRLH